MSINKLVEQNYKRFCAFEGSDFIASEFALKVILKIIRKYNFNNVLELGLGIGSISDTVLKFAKENNVKINYVGTEKNEFCLNALKSNVVNYNEIELYSELNEIQNRKFDFIIIDGYDDTLNQIHSFCNPNAIIFIEGDRQMQRKIVQEIFPKHKYVHIVTVGKQKPYAHGNSNVNNFDGGGQLIFINPTNKMKFHWLTEKLKTAIKLRIREILLKL